MRHKKNEKNNQDDSSATNWFEVAGNGWFLNLTNKFLSFTKQMLDSLHNMHAWALVLI